MNLEQTIIDVLHDIGTPPHLKGYMYVTEAVTMVHEDYSLIYNVYRNLYSQIAEKFNTTVPRVERCIRSVVDYTYDHGDPDTLYKYFGNCIGKNTWKPTNRVFIATVVQWVRVRCTK